MHLFQDEIEEYIKEYIHASFYILDVAIRAALGLL